MVEWRPNSYLRGRHLTTATAQDNQTRAHNKWNVAKKITYILTGANQRQPKMAKDN